MKNTIQFLCFIMFLVSCNNGLKGKGDIKEKEIRLEEPISKLEIKGNYYAVLLQSEDQKVVIEAQENLLQNVEIDQNRNSLSISESKNVETNEIYKVYIYSTKLERVSISDNVEFDVSGEIRKNDFNIKLQDNAKLLSQVFIENLEIDMKDNSSMTLKGTSSVLEASLEDNAQLIAPDFIISDADIDLSDNAQMNVQIMSNLEGQTTGNSVLEYRGAPNKDFQEKDQSKILKIE